MTPLSHKPNENQQPKLLDQVRQAIRTRHYSLRTEEAYVGWVKRFVLFHHQRHPRDMGAKEVQQFLSDLAVNHQVAASTQNQALSAILFLYQEVLKQDIGWLNDVVRAKKPQKLPVVLTREEVKAVVGRLSGAKWIMRIAAPSRRFMTHPWWAVYPAPNGSWRICCTAPGFD